MGELQKNKTAVLLFTRTAKEEALTKDFSDNNHFSTNYLLAEKFISHAEKIAKKSGLPCFIISSDLQQGNSFGEKLSSAFATIFKYGFNHAIAIGNDCPGLHEKDIVSAAEKLETFQCVLGPAKDGGLYLIGLSKSIFNKNAFEKINWESRETKNSFIVYLHQSGANYFVAEIKHDIDTAKELKQLLKNNSISGSFKNFITCILASLHISHNYTAKIIKGNTFLRSSSLKAPPSI